MDLESASLPQEMFVDIKIWTSWSTISGLLSWQEERELDETWKSSGLICVRYPQRHTAMF